MAKVTKGSKATKSTLGKNTAKNRRLDALQDGKILGMVDQTAVIKKKLKMK